MSDSEGGSIIDVLSTIVSEKEERETRFFSGYWLDKVIGKGKEDKDEEDEEGSMRVLSLLLLILSL